MASVFAGTFWVPIVAHMVAFLEMQFGGEDGKLWKKFKDPHNLFVPSDQRQILGRVFEAFGNVEWARIVYTIL